MYSHYQVVHLNEMKKIQKQASLWMRKFSGIRGIDSVVQYPCMMWANDVLFNFLPCQEWSKEIENFHGFDLHYTFLETK